MTATGWAVVEGDVISVRSVSSTRRGAVVNFLVTDRKLRVHDAMTDITIEALWEMHRRKADVIQVSIRRLDS